MTENVENGQSNNEAPINDQEAAPVPASDNESDESGETDDSAPPPPKAPDSDDDDELPLPEPDVADDEAKKKKELPEWMKKKVDREKRAAEQKTQEAEQLRQENARLKAGIPQPVTPTTPPQQGFDPYMPQREQYNNDSEYFMALGDYRDMRNQAQYQYSQQQATIKKHEEEFQRNLDETIETGRSKYKDFDERTDYILHGDGFPSNRGMAEAIVESKYKDDILYFLGTNLKEAERIANLNPVQAAKDIAKLEVRFDAKRKSNVTKAPAALKSLSGGGAGGATHGDPNKMGIDEFSQWYKDKFGG